MDFSNVYQVTIFGFFWIAFWFLIRVGVLFLLIYFAVRVWRKYSSSKSVREEKKETVRSLGEVLKQHRTECRMTQEFVAESLGVSRQAVSKWENGISEPSTSNLIQLAKLFQVEPEDLLRELRE